VSKALRIALVAEGPTDKVLIEAAISALLGQRTFILKQLQPEESLAFGAMGTGWGGVYKWCRQAASRAGGALRNDVLFLTYDLLVLHLDADVADKNYPEAGVVETIQDLPCVEPCPPPSATTDRLRRVLLRWGGESATPPRTVLCTPSKSADAWVLKALFPNDSAVRAAHLECDPNPGVRFTQQPIAKRITKGLRDYQNRAAAFQEAWPRISSNLSEARRFSSEFLGAVNTLS